jgi:hypothetical protein
MMGMREINLGALLDRISRGTDDNGKSFSSFDSKEGIESEPREPVAYFRRGISTFETAKCDSMSHAKVLKWKKTDTAITIFMPSTTSPQPLY